MPFLRSLFSTLIILPLLVLNGCSSVKINHDYDPQYAYASIVSYYLESKLQPDPDDLPLPAAKIKNMMQDLSESLPPLPPLPIEPSLPAAKTQPTAYLYRQVEQSINNNLSRKYQQKKNPSTASVNVYYRMGEETKLDIQGPTYSTGFMGPGSVVTSSPARVTPYQEGRLIIDIVDNKSNQIIWQSTATAKIDNSMTPEEKQTKLNETITKMLASFPPQ
ncbi:DUF4136 domain-containing protein [Shewanella surugensis]|uniref:DUF4136 domain-containing protein n=1 Tax=Shewanella surugensis TaxID=212020 RepID=A0ABT0LBS0_9GAMM|nr:DUF4136 domain-containing protein [Shewanella surugensis]MCL1124950.1 DUF4136 domain-containing protein [Shewanella surugensis]